jgi:hypothetical protein
MGQQAQGPLSRTRPFVADPAEWEVVDDGGDEYEPVEAPAKTWSDKLGLNAPVPSMPAAGPLETVAAASLGLLRGVGSGAVDLAQGAASSILNKLNQNPTLPRVDPNRPTGLPTMELPASIDKPKNISGTVGSALPDIALMATPAGELASAAKGVAGAVLPSAARAGAKFEQVMGAAKDVPVNVEPLGQVALRIMELAERGGTMPRAVSKLLLRITNPSKTPMNYKEARDFASNIGRLSVDEMNRLTPVMKRQVADLAAQLNKANAEAARAAGKGAEYKAAMREYANAMKMRDALDVVIKKAKKAALPVAAGGGGALMSPDVLTQSAGGGQDDR